MPEATTLYQEPQDTAPSRQPEFQFAFRGPGLSFSLTTTDPDILTQYAAMTFFGGSPAAVPPIQEATRGTTTAPELRSALPEDGPGSPNAEALQQPAPKQTRGRAKDKVEEPKKEEPKPEPVAEKTEPASAAAPTQAQVTEEFVGASLTKDQLVEMTVACFGKDRSKVTELLGKFGAKRFSELPENKLGEYGSALSALAKELKV